MASRLVDDFVLVLQDNAVVLRNLSSIIASWVMRHIVSPILRKGFSSSIISFYPKSVYQITLLQLGGEVNPNPGPNGTEQHSSTGQQKVHA